MQIVHRLEETTHHFKMVKYHLKRAKHLRTNYDDVKFNDELTFKVGALKYLKQIEKLHLNLFGIPLYPWLLWIYRFRARDLMSVLVDKNDNVVAYDLFFFQEVEWNDNIIHELYVGVDRRYQAKGLGVAIRRLSTKSYDDGCLSGISTLAALDNIKAIRTAQKTGYAILKTSAKPYAYYMYMGLNKRRL